MLNSRGFRALSGMVITAMATASVCWAQLTPVLAPATPATATATTATSPAGDGRTDRVLAILKWVRQGPAQMAVDASYDKCSAIAQMEPAELDYLAGELLKSLEDTTAVPFGGMVMDAGTREVRHQALYALQVAAGIPLGEFAVRGGFGPPPPANWRELDAEQAKDTIQAWNDWWKRSKGKPMAQWLEERRPALNKALAAVREGSKDSKDQMLVALAGYSGDAKAFADFAAVAEAEWRLRKGGQPGKMDIFGFMSVLEATGRLGGAKALPLMLKILREEGPQIETSTVPVGAVLDAIAQSGDLSAAGEIMALAKTVNDRQTPELVTDATARPPHQRSALLRGCDEALRKLTGSTVSYQEMFVVKNMGFTRIKPEAFDKWGEALKKAQAATRPARE